MTADNQSSQPKNPEQTYGLMELVKGTSPMVEKSPENTVSSWPHLLIMELLAVLGTTVVLLLMSAFINAPLREFANPDITENPAKAAWYFMNLQEMLLHMHPALAGVIIPVLMAGVLMALPYMDYSKGDVGIWFASRKGRTIAFWSAIYTSICCIGLIFFDEFIRVRSLISAPEILPAWIIPITVIGGLSVLLVYIIRMWNPTRRETFIGLFAAFVATYVVLLIAGLFFRGLGMHLTWPWDLPPNSLTF